MLGVLYIDIRNEISIFISYLAHIEVLILMRISIILLLYIDNHTEL